jgi:hypothetical protein
MAHFDSTSLGRMTAPLGGPPLPDRPLHPGKEVAVGTV